MLKPFAGSSTDPLLVAVLGTGRLGETHVAALARLRDRGVAVAPALYGRNPDKVAALATQYRITRTSTELDELIDADDVHVVDNCLVNALHLEPLMRAIRLGKHVFSEKPLTMALSEAERLLDAAEAAGVLHGVI